MGNEIEGLRSLFIHVGSYLTAGILPRLSAAIDDETPFEVDGTGLAPVSTMPPLTNPARLGGTGVSTGPSLPKLKMLRLFVLVALDRLTAPVAAAETDPGGKAKEGPVAACS